jgi:hypothetical protein
MSSFTVYFAQLTGLYFLVLSVILAVRKRAIIDLMPQMAESQPFIFLAGTIRIIIGLAVLIGNGSWGSSALPAVVALLGWISLIRGIAMLLVTRAQEMKLIEFWRRDAAYFTAVALVFVLGIYLTREGFALMA